MHLKHLENLNGGIKATQQRTVWAHKLILGGQYVPKSSRDKGFFLKKPGTYHHARFMAKAIYILKMFILSNVINKLTVQQERIICRMTIFILSLYGKYFLQSSLTTAAPRLDKKFFDKKVFDRHNYVFHNWSRNFF